MSVDDDRTAARIVYDRTASDYAAFVGTEISEDIDSDPRSIYFKQAARGVPIRMAILSWLLGRLDVTEPDTPQL